MDKPETSGSKELQCVGKLEIVRPKPVGFLCGSIPVPTDKAFHGFDSALIPSAQTVQAPRYRMIPTETDLNMLPLLSSIPDKVLPLTSAQTKTNTDLPWENGAIASNLTRKGEALAVSGVAEYGDEIDVIAPTDILKQLFKMPYSRAHLSIAVHRVGQTLVLNTGPEVEEGEKLVRRRNHQAKCADKSLFLNFAMHSVRMEACDCPPDHHTTSKETSASSILLGQFGSRDEPVEASQRSMQGHASSGDCDQIAQDKGLNHHREYSQSQQGDFFWGKKKNKKNRGPNAVKKVSKVKEKPRCSMQESDKFRRVNNDGFLRVLFWQFHNFRMLLGSDLLILSNDKYVAVSLHLWDVSRQVTPLTWLEAWLDNVMASVPELAICYHQDGVVQGYELLKTEDIFLLKGVSEDGTPAFHPHVVQQNGLMVLRFLQENCKQDPGAYWLHKSPGEDVIQLFDLSVMPKKHATDDCDDTQSVLPSLIHRGRSDSLLSLGTLLYRIAHRLSLSMSPEKRARCVRFFRQCLDFLDEPDHLVVRAFAHEQFARLLLTYDEEVDLTSEVLPTDSEVIVTDAEEDSFEVIAANSETTSCDVDYSDVSEVDPGKDDETIKDSVKRTLDTNLASRTIAVSSEPIVVDDVDFVSSSSQSFSICNSSKSVAHVGQHISDPIFSKLTAIHHVSQAIKSLRCKRQLHSTESNWPHASRIKDELHSPLDFSVCACGDADCIEVCDIREWLPTSKLDDKSWKLILLLGESYLALGQAYKDDGQLFQALKVVELACLVYGSVPQHYEDKRYISSMVSTSPTQVEIIGRCDKSRSFTGDDLAIHQSSSFLFWVKAWTLVGDVYAEFHLIKGKENPMQSEKESFTKEVKMSSEVFREVERLRNKLGQFSQNCSSCSLMNCSCQSDRASSGNSASSSSGDAHPLPYGRKQSKRSSAKGTSYSHPGSNEDDRVHLQDQNKLPSESRDLKYSRNDISSEMPSTKTDSSLQKQFAASEAEGVPNINVKMNDGGGLGTHSETLFKERTQVRNGGIFKYARNPVIGDGDDNLIVAINCYEEARKALGQSPSSSVEFQSVTRKKGWACNELGRSRLERRDMHEAEIAFADAISTFKEVSDYTNIVLINCNLGHGRRSSAEEMVAKLETFKEHAIFQNAYRHALENAKLEYSESLRYYGAAKMEVNSIPEGADSVSSSLRDEVCTQFAHTYLRLGMLLARENTVAEVYENGILEDYSTPIVSRSKREHRNHEISANEAIREALSMYESLGELRKQEAAYAHFQLACYQSDCCLKFLESDLKKNSISRGENQRVKQYASLADRNWQKSIDFYGPGTHPVMYLTILIERAAFSLSLSSSLHSTSLLDSALLHLLEGRHLSENKSLYNDNPGICAKFWSELQTLLKKMLSLTLSTNTQKSVANSQQTSMKKSGDVAKLRELYKMSLKSTEFSQLHAMHSLWTS